MNPLAAQARYAMLPLLQVVALASFFPGGVWLWLGGVLLLALTLVADDLRLDAPAAVASPHRLFLEGALLATVPLTTLTVLGVLILAASPGTPLAMLPPMLGIEGPPPWIDLVAAIFSVGLLMGPAAGAFGHELMHRSTRRDWYLAEWLLAHVLFTPFAVEHVYGHHRNVGLSGDVATVPRGMSFWRYMPLSFIAVHRGAARIEARRMRRCGFPFVTWQNRFLQGLLLEAVFLVAVFLLAGVSGLVAFIVTAALALLVIELSNYVGHYGLVRVPGQPVYPRHAWNGPQFVSTGITVGLTRHSHHHISAGTPYWRLSIMGEAPVLPRGLGVMSALALFPPLYFRTVAPLLEDWDRRLASLEELAAIKAAEAVRDPGRAPRLTAPEHRHVI